MQKSWTITLESTTSQTTDGVWNTYERQFDEALVIKGATISFKMNPWVNDTAPPHPGECMASLMVSQKQPSADPNVVSHLASGQLYAGHDTFTRTLELPVTETMWLYLLTASHVANVIVRAVITVVKA